MSVSDIGEIANAMGAAALVFHSLLPDGLPERATREREDHRRRHCGGGLR